MCIQKQYDMYIPYVHDTHYTYIIHASTYVNVLSTYCNMKTNLLHNARTAGGTFVGNHRDIF